MKKQIALLLLTLVVCVNSSAQNKSKIRLYTSIGYYSELFDSAEISLYLVESHGFLLQTRGAAINKNDYSTQVQMPDGNYGASNENWHSYARFQILGGYRIHLDKKNRYNLYLKTGVGFHRHEYPINLVYHPATTHENYIFSWTEPAYVTHDYKVDQTTNLIINPSFEFLFSKNFGISLAPYYATNASADTFGWQISFLIGMLNP